MRAKSYLESRTLWFNLLTSVFGIFQEFSTLGLISQEWVLVGNVIGNVLLRLVTTQPVTLTGKP